MLPHDPSGSRAARPVLRRLRMSGAGPRPTILLRPLVDLDVAAETQLRTELARYLADSRLASGCVVVLHLGGRFVDARALLALVETAESARRLGSVLAVVAPSGGLVRMLDQLPDWRRLAVFASVTELSRASRTGAL